VARTEAWQEEMQRMLNTYLSLGIVCIPCGFRSKRPIVSWREYQKRKPQETEVVEWFLTKRRSIAAVCGQISQNLAFIDLDSEALVKKLEGFVSRISQETMTIRTSRGVKIGIRSVKPVRSFQIPVKGAYIEIHGENHLDLLPPSVHPSGVPYEHIGKLELIEVDDLEEGMWKIAEEVFSVKKPEDYIAKRKKEIKEPYKGPDPPCIKKLMKGVPEGSRNEGGIRLATYWLNFRGLDPETVWHMLQDWNRNNSPPLPKAELKAILDSALNFDGSYGCDKLQLWCDLENCPLRGGNRKKKSKRKAIYLETDPLVERRSLYYYRLVAIAGYGYNMATTS